jgi:RimJ/RimL family protein N-acetyltransferase
VRPVRASVAGMPRVNFDPQDRCPIVSFLTGETYFLARADRVEATPERLAEVTAICNQPEVYRWIFSEMLAGQPYPASKAVEFANWSRTGWREGTHFVFLVLNGAGQVAAACDIKQNEADGAEVGYWASAGHRGVMTAAVLQLCALAREAGFRSLYARVRKPNARSARVLKRAAYVDRVPAAGDGVYDWYDLNLVA